MLKVFDKYRLYKRTGWFSKDCEDILKMLSDVGLSVVDTKELNHIKEMAVRDEDDGK